MIEISTNKENRTKLVVMDTINMNIIFWKIAEFLKYLLIKLLLTDIKDFKRVVNQLKSP